jgi:hypothetical protein
MADLAPVASRGGAPLGVAAVEVQRPGRRVGIGCWRRDHSPRLATATSAAAAGQRAPPCRRAAAAGEQPVRGRGKLQPAPAPSRRPARAAVSVLRGSPAWGRVVKRRTTGPRRCARGSATRASPLSDHRSVGPHSGAYSVAAPRPHRAGVTVGHGRTRRRAVDAVERPPHELSPSVCRAARGRTRPRRSRTGSGAQQALYRRRRGVAELGLGVGEHRVRLRVNPGGQSRRRISSGRRSRAGWRAPCATSASVVCGLRRTTACHT